MKQSLLGLENLTAEQINNILSHASEMKKVVLGDNKKIANLQGKTVVNLFYENSTRTRTSFELAAKYMGATTVNIAAGSSSVAKGETLVDTGKTLDAQLNDFLRDFLRSTNFHPQDPFQNNMSGRIHKVTVPVLC